MAESSVKFNIVVEDRASEAIKELTAEVEKLSVVAKHTQNSMLSLGAISGKLDRVIESLEALNGKTAKIIDTNNAHSRSQNELAQKMLKTMEAGNAELKSLKGLSREEKNLKDKTNEATNAIEAQGKKSRSVFGMIDGMFNGLSKFALGFNQIVDLGKRIWSTASDFIEANKAQQEAEAKLAQVMRNTMGASNAEIESIKSLASAQQALGVVGDEVQLAGAQELSTYLSKKESLANLLPVMNDMVAQQYGLNATQESAVNIATMLGKVMDGQVGALSRYGYTFDEAQEKILKYGTEEERVATLAEVVGASVGGMNAALAATPEGKMQQLANRLGDIKERVGSIFQGILVSAMPMLETVWSFFENGITRVIDFVEVIKSSFSSVFSSLWSNIKGIFAIVINMYKKIFDFIKTSVLIRDIFVGIGAVVKMLGNVVMWIIGKVGWWYDNVILPILRTIEKGYRIITGRKGYEPQKQEAKQIVNNPLTIASNNMAVADGYKDNIGSGLGTAESTRDAAVTGGTRNSVININLGKMIETVMFNGTFGENESELQSKVEECLLRTLNAAMSVG